MRLTERRISLILIAVSLVLLTVGVIAKNNFSAFSEKDIYVSPSGSDTNPGTISQPYLTIGKARDHIRANHLTGATVYLRGGVYQMSQQLTFINDDSGKNNSPNVYRAYPGEKPILRGSTNVSQFTPYKGNIVVADLSAQGLSSLDVTDLYMNGEEQILARYPNYRKPDYTALDPHAGNFLYTVQPVTGNARTFSYDKTKLNPSAWTNTANAEVVTYAGSNYWNDIRKISSIDSSAGSITLAADASYPFAANNEFYVQKVFQELDAPGEWYFDSVAKKLYFYPPRTLTADDRISVPVSQGLININWSKYLELRGITFEESLGNGLTINNSQYIDVADNEVRNIEKDAISFSGMSENNRIEQNIIHEIGSNGVYLSQADSYRKNLTSTGNIVTNNKIYRIGRIKNNTSGINFNSTGVTVSHNEVFDTPRIGIAFLGNDNVIEYNKVYDTNRITQDSGGIYSLGRSWLYRGNIVRNNAVHDTGGYQLTESGWRYGRYTMGIYLDDFSSGNKVYNNIVYRTGRGSIMVHGGRDNEVFNNISVESTTSAQILFQGWDLNSTGSDEAMWAELRDMVANGYDRAKYLQRYPGLATITADLTTDNLFANNKLHNNIVYFPGNATTDLYWAFYFPSAPDNVVNDNIIWNNSDSSTLHAFDPKASLHGGIGSRYSWDQWKALGFDTRSIIANPLFVDPGKDNYALQPNSPALVIGFQPIDQSKMGIEQSSGVVIDDSTNGGNFNSSASSNSSSSNSAKASTKKQVASGAPGTSVQNSSAIGDNLALTTQNQPPEPKWYEKLRNWIVNVWGVSELWLKNSWVRWLS